MASLQKLGIGQTISDMLGMAKPEWEKSPGLVVSKLSQIICCHNNIVWKISQNNLIMSCISVSLYVYRALCHKYH